MNKIEILNISETKIKTYWEESPHGTAFTNPFILKNLAYKVKWFVAKKGDEILCCWPVCLNEENKVYLPDFSYYVGPFWTKRGLDFPNHRLISRRIAVYESFLKKFEKNFGSFICSLPIGINDIRVFDWWNYHNEKKPRVNIYPRYTAQVSYPNSSFKIEKLYREVRRQELRKALKFENFYICDDVDPELICDLYFSILSKQNLKINESTKNSIMRLYNVASRENGYLNVIKDKKTQEPAYISLILRGKGISNLVLSLTNNKFRNNGVSVFGIHSTIKKSLSMGDLIFDFNGANSPKRSDDKHSYGAEDKLYFNMTYNM